MRTNGGKKERILSIPIDHHTSPFPPTSLRSALCLTCRTGGSSRRWGPRQAGPTPGSPARSRPWRSSLGAVVCLFVQQVVRGREVRGADIHLSTHPPTHPLIRTQAKRPPKASTHTNDTHHPPKRHKTTLSYIAAPKHAPTVPSAILSGWSTEVSISCTDSFRPSFAMAGGWGRVGVFFFCGGV